MLKINNIQCWILCHPRTGSTFLCELLNNTGLFPVFKNNHLHEDRGPLEKNRAFDEWIRAYDSKSEFIKKPPMCAKIIHHQFIELLDDTTLVQILTLLPRIKFILLQRKNKIDQAISCYIAEQLNCYHLYNNNMMKEFTKKNVPINKKKLIETYNNLLLPDKWDLFLGNHPRFTIDYDDLIREKKRSLKNILCYLNIEAKNLDECINISEKRLLKMKHPLQDELKKILKTYVEGN